MFLKQVKKVTDGFKVLKTESSSPAIEMCLKQETAVLSLTVIQVSHQGRPVPVRPAPLHKKRPEDCLGTSVINIGPLGKHPQM